MWWPGCLLVLAVCSNAAQPAQHVVGVFKAKPNAQFEHLSLDRITGKIYVGAVNHLYQLDKDLNLVQSEETSSFPMSNHNKALLIDYINSTLITCGSLTGTCMLRSLHNLSQVLENVNEQVVTNYVEDSTFAFIAPGPYNKHVMYVGVTYTGKTTENFRPGIASRSLDPDSMFQLANNRSQGTRTYVNSEHEKQFIINYVYGFASQGFSYFLTTQRKTNVMSSPYISKLVRICHNDPKYYSYTEVPITCNSKDGKQYNLVQAGFVGKPGSNLAKALAVNTEDDVLFAVFSTSSDSNRPGNDSALCVYSLASIRQTFTENTRACYSGIGKQGLDFLYGIKACEKKTSITINDDFCGESYNNQIGGEQPVEAQSGIQFDVRATAVTATSTGNDTVVFIGTQNGYLKKIVQDNFSRAFEYANVKIDHGVAVNADLHLEPNGKYLYAMTEKSLSKVKVQECNLYKTCWECLSKKDPYCGWSTVENKCTPRSDYNDSNSWTSYQSWTNPTIDGKEILVASNTRTFFVCTRQSFLSVSVAD